MPRGSARRSSASRPGAWGSMRRLPQPASPVRPPAPSQGGKGSAAGGTDAAIVEGMAFGGGNAFVQRALDFLMGPRVFHHEGVASPMRADAPAASTSSSRGTEGPNACGDQTKAMIDCLDNFAGDIGKCQLVMDMLLECKRSSGARSA